MTVRVTSKLGYDNISFVWTFDNGADLEATAYEWAQEILAKSPISIKMLKFAMNLTDDGMVGQQVFAGEATRLAYMTDEAKEGRDAFLEKRPPNFEKKWIP